MRGGIGRENNTEGRILIERATRTVQFVQRVNPHGIDRATFNNIHRSIRLAMVRKIACVDTEIAVPNLLIKRSPRWFNQTPVGSARLGSFAQSVTPDTRCPSIA